MKKAVKLDPIRKNGREKRAFINDIDDDDDTDLTKYKRESALDYLDDEEEEE